MSFVRQAALASSVVALVVGALWFVGHEQQTRQDAQGAARPGETSTPAAPAAPGTAQGSETPLAPLHHPTRALVPPDAWLVVDFEGDLTGQKPFADSPGSCAQVPAPERVALALLPPAQPAEGPEVLLAAAAVEDVFWGCARDRVVQAGGTVLAQNDRFEVLKSPSGVVARGPERALLFLSGEAHLERALSVLSDLVPHAASQGRHLALLRRLHPNADKAPATRADLTLALPPGWLDAVGKEAEQSPLRALSAAYLSIGLDGAARGGADCEEAGCEALLAFLNRAVQDLLSDAAPQVRYQVSGALHMEHVPGSGRIAVTWSPTAADLPALLSQMLGGLRLGGAP